MKTKQLTIGDVEWTIICEPEDIPIRGNAMASGDDAFDRKVENRIIRELSLGHNWAWGSITVTGRYKSLVASDHLGCCNYRNEKDFRKDDYFKDMQSNILEDLQSQLLAELVRPSSSITSH